MSYIYNMTDTWNNGATVFTAIKMNVTNTASAAGSLLMDLQVGGTSVFSVSQGTTAAVTIIGNTNNRAVGPIVGKSAGGSNTGTALTLDATDNTGGHTWSFISTGSTAGGGAGNFGFYDGTLGQYNAYISNTGGLFIQFPNNAFIGWSSGSDASSPADTGLWRDAASVIAQRNSTNAQTLRIYNTYSGGGSNYERVSIGFPGGGYGNGCVIQTEKAGTGAAANLFLNSDASILFQVGGTNCWQIDSGGIFKATTDNTYDIGANGATRPRNLYLGTACHVDSGTITASTPALNITQTWNNAATQFFGGIYQNVTATAYGTNSKLFELDLNGSPVYEIAVATGGNITQRFYSAGFCNLEFNPGVGTWGQISNQVGNLYIVNNSAGFIFRANNTSTDQWTFGIAGTDITEIRRTTNAQTLRIYNTYTDASNYERGVFDWGTTSNVLTIGTQAAGTGSSRNMQFLIGGTNASFLMGSGASSVTPTLAVVSSTGMAVALLCGTNASAFCFDSAGVFWVMPDTHAHISGNNAGANNPFFEIDTQGNATLGSTALLGWSNSAQNARANLSDLALGRNGAASLRLGAADAASAVAQTLGVQSVAAGHTNTAGANFTIAGSLSNGSGASGDIIIQTGDTGAASGTQNAFNTALTIKGGAAAGKSGSIVIGSAAIATNATDGFLYIPTCAGTPTGAPTAFTGRVAMVYDTTNNKFYIYNGGWKGGTNPGAFT